MTLLWFFAVAYPELSQFSNRSDLDPIDAVSVAVLVFLGIILGLYLAILGRQGKERQDQTEALAMKFSHRKRDQDSQVHTHHSS